MKVAELMSLQRALEEVAQRDSKESYKLKGQVRINIALNTKAVAQKMSALEEERNKLVKRLSTDGKQVDADKSDEYQASLRELLESEVDVDLKPVSTTDLNLDENPIPIGVLCTLDELMS